MTEYLKFWLAQHIVAAGLMLLGILGLLIAALWSMRGQKFYKESPDEKARRKARAWLGL